MANILIIGGSRFIGKTLLDMLALTNHQLYVLNRGSIPNEDYLPEGVIHMKVDRSNKEEMTKALGDTNFEIVFDICAITKDHVSILLEILEGKIKRHVHVSSGSVYDEPNALSIPISEDFPYPELKEDTHPYIVSKTEAELELYKAFNERNFPMTIVRPTFVYGPRNYVYREAYFFDRIFRERYILLPSKGLGYFDMVHVEDCARLIMQCGFAPDEQVLGEAFNASRGLMLSGNMYAKIVANNLGKEAKILHFTFDLLKELGWPQDKSLYPYVPEGAMGFSTRKAEDVLGFEHNYNYQLGLDDAYQWWEKQENKEPEWEMEDLVINYLLAEKNTDVAGKAELKQKTRDEISKLIDENK